MSKTIKGRLKNLDKYIQSKWGEYYWNFLMKYEDKLDWDSISRNPNITMEIIENNLDKSWNWKYISMNPNITMEIIENNPDKPWKWGYNGISRNPNITMKFINDNPNKSWDWNCISKNPNITIKEFIRNNPSKTWNWMGLSEHKFIKEKELFYQKYYRIYLATFRLQQYFNRMYDNPKYLFCRTRLEKLFT